jgi:hypothetical protein
MNLKQILESVVAELESIAATVGAIEAVLIEKKTLDPNDVETLVPNALRKMQERLIGIRTSISRLPDSLQTA